MTPHLLRRLARHDGQAMAITMMVLLVTMGLAYAAFGAVGGDFRGSKRDTDAKRAYAAAQAGIADYVSKLENDNDFWVKCTDVPDPNGSQPAPVNQLWNGVLPDPRDWRRMPTDPTAAYTIELVPAAPATACVKDDEQTMLTSAGTLRIKTTGRAGLPGREVKRSIVTTLRRRGFLDFIYFTDLETGDPTQLIVQTGGDRVKRCRRAASDPFGAEPACVDDNLASWADQADTCRQYRKTDGTGRNQSLLYPGSRFYAPDNRWYHNGDTTWARIPCSLIQFAPTDAIKGPFHSNDTIYVCDQPDFGRNRAGATDQPVDRIEHWGVVQACGTDSIPDYGNNDVIAGPQAGILQLPETNTELRTTAEDGGYVFEGTTTIELSGTGMTVNGVARPYPANGLVYVANSTSGSCSLTNVLRPYDSAPACGDVNVKGTYGANLTIAAERDVVVTGDLRRATGSSNLMGLIANNFVRVEHHMVDDNATCSALTPNAVGTSQDRTIQAAMLSLGHVFTVDNYQCGAKLGILNVLGAIGQKYRGPVGTSGGGGGTGYIKNYVYDDRLKYRSPPFFLPPVQSAWKVLRSTEQSPAL